MATQLSGIAETLLIPTRVRAYETTRPDSLLQDPWAVEIMHQLNLEHSTKDKVFAGTQIGTVLRTLLIDSKIMAFTRQHPDGVVINLGCGLDARYQRLPLSSILWFDLDIADVIALRNQFFDAESANHHTIASSMFDTAWMAHIPKDRPILVFFEGVSMYFPEHMMKALLSDIANQFTHADMVFDVMSTMAVKRTHPDVKKYDARFKWGVDSGLALLPWHEHLTLVAEESYMVQPPFYRWPWPFRLLRWLPAVRNMARVIHLSACAPHAPKQ